jgi:hypothetical protein
MPPEFLPWRSCGAGPEQAMKPGEFVIQQPSQFPHVP